MRLESFCLKNVSLMKTIKLGFLSILIFLSSCARDYCGRVIDKAGSGVGGATVELVTNPASVLLVPQIKREEVARTDENGDFCFPARPGINGTVRATKENLAGGIYFEQLSSGNNKILVQ